MSTLNAEWFFWYDTDSIIMNPNIYLEDFIEEDYNLILSSEAEGMNTGHFLIRNCEWSKNLLNKTYARTEVIHHFAYEQEAMVVEFKEHPEWMQKGKFLSQRALDAYSIEQSTSHLCKTLLSRRGLFDTFCGVRNTQF